MITRTTTAPMNPLRSRWRSRSISRLGAAPKSTKTVQATTTIAEKFVRKRMSAPPASPGRPSSRQIPTVASGGTSETAMATPAGRRCPFGGPQRRRRQHLRRGRRRGRGGPARCAPPATGVRVSGSGITHETRYPIADDHERAQGHLQEADRLPAGPSGHEGAGEGHDRAAQGRHDHRPDDRRDRVLVEAERRDQPGQRKQDGVGLQRSPEGRRPRGRGRRASQDPATGGRRRASPPERPSPLHSRQPGPPCH